MKRKSPKASPKELQEKPRRRGSVSRMNSRGDEGDGHEQSHPNKHDRRATR